MSQRNSCLKDIYGYKLQEIAKLRILIYQRLNLYIIKHIKRIWEDFDMSPKDKVES